MPAGSIFTKTRRLVACLVFFLSPLLILVSPDKTFAADVTYDRGAVGSTGGSPAASFTITGCTTTVENSLMLLGIAYRSGTQITTPPSGGPGSWTFVSASSATTTVRLEVWRQLATATTSNFT